MTSFLIGATTSNSGKTTITMGLLRALSNRGLIVQPYKCGPDYIDTMFHKQASGRKSINLDTFMSSTCHIKELFELYSVGADIRIVEGVMGLYDGYDTWQGSSAEIAMLLDIPVILAINAKSVAYSVAPLIHGFHKFIPPKTPQIPSPQPLNVAGVIFNQVASETHYQHLRKACEDGGVVCLGYLPHNPQLTVPSRHLGLTITEKENMESFINLAAQEAGKHINIDKLLELLQR